MGMERAHVDTNLESRYPAAVSSKHTSPYSLFTVAVTSCRSTLERHHVSPSLAPGMVTMEPAQDFDSREGHSNRTDRQDDNLWNNNAHDEMRVVHHVSIS